MVHFWCSFGAFAPKVHQTAGALSALLHQKCTKTAQGNGALLALLHQKCTRNAPPLVKLHRKCTTWPKCIKSASKAVHFWFFFTKSAPKVHFALVHFWRFCTKRAPKLHQCCGGVTGDLEKIGKFFQKIPEKFDRLGKFSKNFPKFFQISSNTARALVQFWCSFGATAPQVHQALISFASARL